ncbi:5'-methylthioadenosine/adenosylhomocysteine nucleosidase [Vagococcus humatus]|uniref:5'-methylthioadenosine/S-adenosylhomocysteine nucleosidase n=1 Tax=Vagococcus humatus TaxID=1889241 RepID=A0A3R9YCD2_9ENTE|nr:5'-methylthioadenosine/adenosylhomocysteine nucleosidase [Vagococcus humatus]RST89117.1 5'-methylthioadenosine/S-adenosylhomocysteine nucleosidase [Vagococcus humatus]
MKIGIIGAMAEEIRLLREEMQEPTEWQEASATFISGKIGDHQVVVVQSGIGKVLAAVTATLLISHYQVDMLINTGSAGGIGESLEIGDLVISNRLAYFDVDVTAFGYAPGQMAGMPLYYEANEPFVQYVEQIAKSQEVRAHTGLIVTGDTFVHSPEQIDQIKSIFPEVLANEMEGAAIAQVATQYQVPFVVLRAMSDVGDENAHINFDEFILEAGKRSAQLVIACIKQLAY